MDHRTASSPDGTPDRPGRPRLSRRSVLFLGAAGLAGVPFLGSTAGLGTSTAPALSPAGRDGEVLDLRDFGARGDGVTDDTRAVQRLLDASARRGAVAVVPAGSYRCTTGLLLRSDVQLHLDRRARLVKDWAAPPGMVDAFLRNADFAVKASRVRITGSGTIGARDHSRTGVVLALYGDDVEIRDVAVDTYAGGQAVMFAGDRGRMHRVTVRNSAAETGTGGIRVVGGVDFLGTECHVESGDDCFQFVPIGNPEAEPTLYNQSIARGSFVGCTGTSSVSRFLVALLEFTGGEAGTTDMDASVTDCSFVQCRGAATNRGIVVKNSHSTGSIERLAFTDCTVDMARAADASTQEIRIQTDATTGGTITGVTFTRTNITNPVNGVLRVGGPNISGLTFDTCDFPAPSGAAPLVAVVDAASDVTFRGCSFSGTQRNGGASKRVLVAGPTTPVTDLVVDGSRFTDIGNTFFGVDVLAATGATITGSSFTALTGATTARAVRLSPEATNVVIQGNDLTGIDHATPVVDRGVGTVVTANTGA